MKLIFITREGYRLPGARVRCYNFSKELSKYGIDSEILSFSDTLGAKDGEEESKMRFNDRLRYNYLAFRRLSRDKEAILYIQRFNYHSFAPLLSYFVKGNRMIFDLDDWEMREDMQYHFGAYPSSKAYYFVREMAKRSILCVAASRFLEDFLLRFNKNVCYLPSGVNAELFKPLLDKPSEQKIILSWSGTLHRREYIDNIEFALSCFSQVREACPNLHFEITGDGIYKNDLVKLLGRFGDDRVSLNSWIDPDSMPGYLKKTDIGLLPVAKDTKFNRAKSPTKLFEYMAMGKPVVCSAIGEAVNIINDGKDGFLARGKEEFISKLRYLIKDFKARMQMGQKARETVENNYSLQVLGERLYGALKGCA